MFLGTAAFDSDTLETPDRAMVHWENKRLRKCFRLGGVACPQLADDTEMKGQEKIDEVISC